MMDKLALKRLTASDLTFFEWHFRNRNAGNQKAINLNADVFMGQLYPALETIAGERQGKLGIDLWIAGPAATEPVNLQRKIIKGDTYKNWRLDGEVVHNPADKPERFNKLEPGDIALFGLEGELAPNTVTLVLVAKAAPEDQALFDGLARILGDRSMMVLEANILRELCEKSPVLESHPVWLIVSEENLAEAAVGQAPAVDRLLSQPRPARFSLDDLRKARRAAEEIGQLGETLVDYHLRERLVAMEITDYEWTSHINAIAPYDFRVQRHGTWEKLEIKTTAGDFGREFHLPLSELREMVHGDGAYRIGRVYKASKNGAKMRISERYREVGQSILNVFDTLPAGVTANGVTIVPDDAMFGEEITLTVPVDDEE